MNLSKEGKEALPGWALSMGANRLCRGSHLSPSGHQAPPTHQSGSTPPIRPHPSHPLGPTPPIRPHPHHTHQTFSSSVLLLAAFTCRVTSSSGSRGHLEAPMVLFLTGGPWVTSTMTPGEAVMLKVV